MEVPRPNLARCGATHVESCGGQGAREAVLTRRRRQDGAIERAVQKTDLDEHARRVCPAEHVQRGAALPNASGQTRAQGFAQPADAGARGARRPRRERPDLVRRPNARRPGGLASGGST